MMDSSVESSAEGLVLQTSCLSGLTASEDVMDCSVESSAKGQVLPELAEDGPATITGESSAVRRVLPELAEDGPTTITGESSAVGRVLPLVAGLQEASADGQVLPSATLLGLRQETLADGQVLPSTTLLGLWQETSADGLVLQPTDEPLGLVEWCDEKLVFESEELRLETIAALSSIVTGVMIGRSWPTTDAARSAKVRELLECIPLHKLMAQ